MITLDINLRLPNITVDTPEDGIRRITNAESRFWKVMQVPALPKVGDRLELSSRGYAFQAVVNRVDWQEGKDRFVLACQYAKRSMTPAMYQDLRADPDWTMRSLISTA
jgi:hypothetical protein